MSFSGGVWLSSVAVEGKTLRPSFVYDIAVGEHLLHGRRVSDEQIQAWTDEAEAGYDLQQLPRPTPGLPLPCWWSRVVRGWASCCGHDVLPLSLDDPGGVVTRGSRALVTADKGNGPLCVRSFVTWVRDRSSTG